MNFININDVFVKPGDYIICCTGNKPVFGRVSVYIKDVMLILYRQTGAFHSSGFAECINLEHGARILYYGTGPEALKKAESDFKEFEKDLLSFFLLDDHSFLDKERVLYGNTNPEEGDIVLYMKDNETTLGKVLLKEEKNNRQVCTIQDMGVGDTPVYFSLINHVNGVLLGRIKPANREETPFDAFIAGRKLHLRVGDLFFMKSQGFTHYGRIEAPIVDGVIVYSNINLPSNQHLKNSLYQIHSAELIETFIRLDRTMINSVLNIDKNDEQLRKMYEGAIKQNVYEVGSTLLFKDLKCGEYIVAKVTMINFRLFNALNVVTCRVLDSYDDIEWDCTSREYELIGSFDLNK